MLEENASLPLADIPEELEHAELAALLDFFRDNAARFEISVLKEQALDAGYRGSVVERAIEEFEKEPRPEPEPPEEREENRASPVPAAPPPKVPAFLEQLAKDAPPEQARYRAGRVSPWLALLIVAVNALVFALLFTDSSHLAMPFYIGEFTLALFLDKLQRIHSGRVAPPQPQEEKAASPVQVASPVPTLAHEAPTENLVPQRDRKKAPVRR